MATNDLILLDKIIEETSSKSLKSLKIGDFFERFCAEQILKNYDLTTEEIEAGITDGSNDGGIDGIYMFINGGLLKDCTELKYIKKESTLEMFIITSKHDSSFEQAAINSEYTTINEFFDLSKANNELINPYNEHILECRNLFISCYMHLATKLKGFKIRYIYVSRGDSNNVGENVRTKSQQLIELTQYYFRNCEVDYLFFGASELLELYRKKREFDLDLPFCEQLSADSQKYIILCKLEDYYNFLKDEKGELKRYLFDSNVRDYNGLNKTNSDILQTLQNSDPVDFWWLNNGITILSSNAVNMGKFIKIENVQIVNGLQTSYTIFEHFQKSPDINDDRKLMVKVITETDPIIRDRIIRATNNQTSIQESSLHATDKIQRDIEDILFKYGLCYERRANYYANQGYDDSLIFSPLYLASGYIALVGKNLSEAMRLKQKFMQNKIAYKSIFEEPPLEFWPKIARIQRNAELLIIKKKNLGEHPSEGYLKTLRHLTSFLALALYYKTFNYNHKDLVRLKMDDIEKLELEKVFDFINKKHPIFEKRIWRTAKFIDELIQEAAVELSIDNPSSVIKRKKKHCPMSSWQKIEYDKEKFDSIKNELPTQPWPKGTHQLIADKLGLTATYVSAVINYFIENDVFYTQMNGKLYDKDGNLILKS